MSMHFPPDGNDAHLRRTVSGYPLAAVLETTEDPILPQWVRAMNGSLINTDKLDAIILRKIGEDEHEVRGQRARHDMMPLEPVLFRGTFADCGDVMAQLGDALGAIVPSPRSDHDDEAAGFMAGGS